MQPGTLLAHYEIIAAIGKGGMGEVWKARDTRLGREVAIKTLPREFAENAERLGRFEREARVLASLNHPSIAAIYGLEEFGGSRFLVLELVDGDTLADRLERGPIPVDESIRLALQIAEAMDAAHEKGVVHRDLKPANIKITTDGKIKILDFGLATAFAGSNREANLSDSPTLTLAATQHGIILGTAAYMSPEQARAEQVDKRADIWAFGVVLYEMVTGKRLFEGKTISDTLAAVLMKEPDLAAAPRQVRKLLRACLEREPKRRLRDIGEAWRLLEGGEAESQPARKTTHAWVPWTAAAVIVLITLAALWTAPWRMGAERPLMRLDVDLGSDISLPSPDSSALSPIAISRDGTRIVYVATPAGGGTQRLFTKRLDQPKATELAGTTGAMGPSFSTDGQWIGFYAGGKFNKIYVDGGAVVPLADTPGFPGGSSWQEDGNIIVAGILSAGPGAGGLARISSGGGTPTKVTDASGDLGHAIPQHLPGGKALLFAAYRGLSLEKASVEVLTFADGHRKILIPGATNAHYLPTSSTSGHLVFSKNSTLFAIPFDVDRLETRGTAIPILDDVAYQAASGIAPFVVSATGTLVYRKSPGGVSLDVTTVQSVIPNGDGVGKREPLRDKPAAYISPRFSPDGTRLAFLMLQGNRDLWVYDQRRDTMTRLTSGGVAYTDPVWTPDGRYIFYGSLTEGMFSIRADGAAEPQPLGQNKIFRIPSSVSPDGKRLAYTDGPQIWTIPLEQADGKLKVGKEERFYTSSFLDSAPAFSPDGKWLAYTSNATGSNEVYVRAFPDTGGRWQISNNGGRRAVWSPNGHDLLYQSGDQIMAVAYNAKGDTFVAEKPRVWLAKLGGTQWDLAPDGKRVAVVTPVDTPESTRQDHEVVFLLNFFDELRRRVPAK